MANWENCPYVERVDGAWVFKGTQLPLYLLYENLASGATVDDFVARRDVAVEQAAGVLEYEAAEFRDDLLVRPDGPGETTPIPVIVPTGAEMPDWGGCPAVERVAGQVSGAWVFRDTRFPLYVLYDNLAGGARIDEFIEWYDCDKASAIAVLEYAARELREKRLVYARSA